MAETYQVQLDRVQATIAKIEETSQSYEIADRNLEYPQLAGLYRREKYLRKQAKREANGGKVRVRRGVL